MLNELVYCPRLFYLEHVQGIFIESADTIEGAAQHQRAERRGRRVTKASGKNAEAEVGETDGSEENLWEQIPRRLTLSSDELGVTGNIDLLEISDDDVVVVEAKHGRAPTTEVQRWGEFRLPFRAWPPDIVQVAVYIGLLREIGVPCERARIFYRGSGERVEVTWSDELERFLAAAILEARRVCTLEQPPEPLRDSPKCVGCSLHEACLPDEHHALVALQEGREETEVRRIVAGRDDRAVVHVVSPGTLVKKDGESLLIVPRNAETRRIPLKDVSHLALFGASHITEPCLQHLLRVGIPISHHTGAGRLMGITAPLSTLNVVTRRAQYRATDDPERCLQAARALVLAKIRNQRTVLKRYRRGLLAGAGEQAPAELDPDAYEAAVEPEPTEAANDAGDGTVLEVPEVDDGDAVSPATFDDAVAATGEALRRMKNSLRGAERATSIDALRGHEGDAGAQYFSAFPMLLPGPWKSDFGTRSRRPPRDRVNALLSFGYALLLRDAAAALARIGLDPMLGLYHTMIPGRPALALDLMEPFRAAWVDTAVLRLVATNGIARTDFHVSGAGVFLSDRGRRVLIGAYERRADELTTHPRFGYRMSYRRILELEARVLAKWLLGEIDELRPIWTR